DGHILADGGSVRVDAGTAAGLVGGVIDMSGIVQARTIGVREGRIILSGDKVDVSGTLDASAGTPDANGGTILVGGDVGGAGSIPNASKTLVGRGAIIEADGAGSGNGGKIVVWADRSTAFDGSISARGGASGGTGGFVETSGHDILSIATGRVDASGSGGAGSWLMDPTDVTIANATTGGTFSGGVFTPGNVNSATVDAGAIASALAGGTNVRINTASGGAGAGDITLASAINVASTGNSSTLTLSAVHDILVQNSLNRGGGNGTLGLVMTAGNAITISGAVTLPANLSATANGAITLAPNAALALAAEPTNQQTSRFIGSLFTQSSGATVSVASGNSLTLQAGDFALSGAAGSIAGNNARTLSILATGSLGLGTATGTAQLSQAEINTITGFVGVPFTAVDGLLLSSNGNLTLDGTISFPDRTRFTSGGDVLLGPSAAIHLLGEALPGASNSFTFTTGGSGTFTQSAGATLTDTPADPVNGSTLLSIIAAHVSLNGAPGSISANGVAIVPFTGLTLGLGTAPGDVQLGQSELDTISASDRQFGSTSNDTILDGALTLASTSSVYGNNITLNPGATVTFRGILGGSFLFDRLYAAKTLTQSAGARIETDSGLLELHGNVVNLFGNAGSIHASEASGAETTIIIGTSGNPIYFGDGAAPAGVTHLDQHALDTLAGHVSLDVNNFGNSPAPAVFTGASKFPYSAFISATDATFNPDARVEINVPQRIDDANTIIDPETDQRFVTGFDLGATFSLVQMPGATIHVTQGNLDLSGFHMSFQGAPGSISGGPQSGAVSVFESINFHGDINSLPTSPTLGIGTGSGDSQLTQAMLDVFSGFTGNAIPPEFQDSGYDPADFSPLQISSGGPINIGGTITLPLATSFTSGRSFIVDNLLTLNSDAIVNGPISSFAGFSLSFAADQLVQAAGSRITAPSVRFVRVPDLGATTLTTALNGLVTADRVELRPGTIIYSSGANRTLTEGGDNATVT
ncbi:MAG: hemagglutinin, partial [Alphaproteobacteria bacterium]|nr:hemagglutinin [Alphaproteobacteria bacterium]